MKEYFFAFINLLFGNVTARKGLILLCIFIGGISFFAVYQISESNAKIYFFLQGLFCIFVAVWNIFKKKK